MSMLGLPSPDISGSNKVSQNPDALSSASGNTAIFGSNYVMTVPAEVATVLANVWGTTSSYNTNLTATALNLPTTLTGMFDATGDNSTSLSNSNPLLIFLGGIAIIAGLLWFLKRHKS